MNRQRYAVRQQNTTRLNVSSRALGPISNAIILVILACLLGLLYLTQVTKTNALSYQLNDLRKQETALKSEQNELEVNAARLLSLERAKNNPVAAKLVSVQPSSSASR